MTRIAIDRLRPNPWRDLRRYPLDEGRVALLQHSIADTGFWDNVLVRASPSEVGMYELAYGHTRLEAARRSGVAEINAPVRLLSDEDMLSIMIHENATVYGHGTQTNNHAVAQSARFVARELLKAEALGGWEWICAGEITSPNLLKELMGDIRTYRSAIEVLRAGELPGREIVGRFLERHGNALSGNEVRTALEALKGTDLAQAAMAEAATWAAAAAEELRIMLAQQELMARRRAEEAERKRLELDERVRQAEERRKAAQARKAEEAEQRRAQAIEDAARREQERAAKEAARQRKEAEAKERQRLQAEERAREAEARRLLAEERARAEPEYDREALEIFDRVPDHAVAFKQAVKTRRIPPSRQKDAALFVAEALTDIGARSPSGKTSWHKSYKIERDDRLTSANIKREVELFEQAGNDLDVARELKRRQRAAGSEEFRSGKVKSIETKLDVMHSAITRFVLAARDVAAILEAEPDLTVHGDPRWREIVPEFQQSVEYMRRLVAQRPAPRRDHARIPA
jgi:ParB-like chromosome segregation protein Spo0J